MDILKDLKQAYRDFAHAMDNAGDEVSDELKDAWFKFKNFLDRIVGGDTDSDGELNDSEDEPKNDTTIM